MKNSLVSKKHTSEKLIEEKSDEILSQCMSLEIPKLSYSRNPPIQTQIKRNVQGMIEMNESNRNDDDESFVKLNVDLASDEENSRRRYALDVSVCLMPKEEVIYNVQTNQQKSIEHINDIIEFDNFKGHNKLLKQFIHKI